MMRNWNETQENIYKNYAKLGNKLSEIANDHFEKNSVFQQCWKSISEEGIWKLPIPKPNGGIGLGWQECVIAMEGLASTYHNIEFFSLLIKQISAIYFISQYGDEIEKHTYIPLLLQGKMAHILISKSISKLININSSPIKSKNKITIYIFKSKNNIAFNISTRKSAKSNSELIQVGNHNIFSPETGVSILYDFINFERILYGILAANFALRVLKKI